MENETQITDNLIEKTPALPEERISLQRTIILALFAVLQIGYAVALVIMREMPIDEILCIALLTVVFLFAFFLSVVSGRLGGKLAYAGTNYSRIFIATVISVALLVGFFFLEERLPDILFPMLVIGLLQGTVLDDRLSVASGLYLVFCYCMATDLYSYFLYGYILMVVTGAFLAGFFRETFDAHEVGRLTAGLFTGVFTALISLLFYYMEHLQIGRVEVGSSLINGVVAGLVAAFLVPVLIASAKREKYATLETLLDDDYSLFQDLKRFSAAEYQHALRVSYFAEKCADAIGADGRIAAAGGRFYRLGKMEGEPEIDNAVAAATNRAFPPEVISILYEYGGVIRKPQTIESAVVHIVDTIVSKVEVLGQTAMQSDWNQDMIIYQATNELSSSGVCDDAGITMNQFLKVREILLGEDVLR